MRLLVTGRPGSGKTTLCEKIAEKLASRGIVVGGMVSKEIREEGIRTGFKIIDLMSGKEAVLAHIKGEGPRIGKYHVKISGIEGLGVSSIENAIRKKGFLIIDEIGPMELLSKKFIEAVEKTLKKDASFLATVHYSSSHSLVKKLKGNSNIKLFELTIDNRDILLDQIIDELT